MTIKSINDLKSRADEVRQILDYIQKDGKVHRFIDDVMVALEAKPEWKLAAIEGKLDDNGNPTYRVGNPKQEELRGQYLDLIKHAQCWDTEEFNKKYYVIESVKFMSEAFSAMESKPDLNSPEMVERVKKALVGASTPSCEFERLSTLMRDDWQDIVVTQMAKAAIQAVQEG